MLPMHINFNTYYSKLLKVSVLLSFLWLNSCKQPEQEIPDHPKQVDSIIDNTSNLLNGGEIKKAKLYLDSAFKTISIPGTLDQWKKYDLNVIFYLNYERDIEMARIYADSMSYILKDNWKKHKIEYAKAIFSHGEVLLAEKRYTEAYKSFYRGKTFTNNYLDSCNYQEFSYKLGMVKFNQGEYLDAISFFKQSFKEGKSCKKNAGFAKAFSARQSTLNTIALCFEKVGKLDSAARYYEEALSFIDLQAPKYPERKPFMQMAKGVIMGNLGGILVTINKNSLAEHYLLESISLNDRPLYDTRDAQTAKLKLANLYLKTKRFKESEKLLNDLEVYLSDSQNNNRALSEQIQLKWYKLKWSYYDQTAQPMPAYNYSQKYHAFQDSINRINTGLKEVDMDQVFKDAEQRHKLELLNKDNQLKKGYLIGSILLSILALIVLSTVWFNLKNSKKLNVKMVIQNEQLQMALTSLEQSQEENTRIMKIVAHDLRSPMATTISIASLILDNNNLLPEDKEMLQLIKTSSLHSLDMITDLLNMNTTAEGLKKDPVEMYTLLSYCIDLLAFKAKEKEQKIILHPSKDIVIQVSREKIWRVISNLIVNAIKFSPEESVIDVTLEIQSRSIQIRIQDEGIGIPNDLKDKIFNMFTDAKRRGTAGEQSFGLGLAISKQIIEAHGGKIWFENNTSHGTTFYVELPISTL